MCLSVRAATPQASLKKLQDIVKKNVARSPTTTLLSQQEFLPLLPDALTASVLSHCSAMTPMGNEPDLGLVERLRPHGGLLQEPCLHAPEGRRGSHFF